MILILVKCFIKNIFFFNFVVIKIYLKFIFIINYIKKSYKF